MVKLTADLLKSVLPEPGKRLELRDAGTLGSVPGLIFRVTEKGKRTWSVRYRNDAGEQRRKSLGDFPAVGLASARDAARKVTGQVASGTDVVAVERGVKAAEVAKRLRTIRGLAEAYFADAALGLHKPNAKGPKRASTITEERRIFDRLIEPEMGDIPLADVRRADIQAFVSKQSRKAIVRPKGAKGPARKAVSNGRHCRTVLRQMFSYAVWKGLVEHNPAHDIAVVMPNTRERILTDAEMKAFWAACSRPQDVEGLSLSPEMGIALKLAAVVLQRGGEVIGAQRQEINRHARTWLIPAVRMKGKRAHLVPLSDLALALIDEAEALIGNGEFLFQSMRSGEVEAPMTRAALTRAMGRVMAALSLPHATPHDLRRTGATAITSERIGIPRFVVSQVIAHAGDTGGAAAVTGRHYDMNDYLPEKRRALDAWAALLNSIVEGRPQASNVVPLQANTKQ